MGSAVQIWKNLPAKREKDFGLENALAGYVRRRWPDKTIAHVAHEWDLSESEAAKVVYAGASKNLLKKLLHHRRGGAALFIELVLDACGTTLERHIHEQAERAADEERSWAAERRRLAVLAARLPGDGVVARIGDQPAGRRRPPHADLG
jgi:hypothetical protein